MIIEIFTFRLATGADATAFLAADAKVQEFMSSLPGIIRRTTARNDDGDWVCIVLWWDDVEYPIETINTADAVIEFMTLIDHDSVQLNRYETLPG